MTDFAITANDARIQYTATASQTAFAYDFPIYDQSHIVVTRVRSGTTTTLVITTDYTVSGVGEAAGGTVTLTSGATEGDLITLYRDVPNTRATDYNESGDLFATTINQDFDLAVMRDQEFGRDLERSLRLSPEDTLATLNAIPSATARAGMFMTFDSSGQPSVASGASDVPVSSAMAVVVAATSLSAARTAMGLGSMATQESNAVSITGGDIAVTSLSAVSVGGSAIAGTSIVAGSMMNTPLLGASVIGVSALTAASTISTPLLGASTISSATLIGASSLRVDNLLIDGSAITIDASQGLFITGNRGGGDGRILQLVNANDTLGVLGMTILFSGTAINSSAVYFFRAGDSSDPQRMIVDGNGNVRNANGVYGTTSDHILKTGIEPAHSQMEDVKELARRMVNFDLISDLRDGTGTRQLGIVAQSAQEVSPGLVGNTRHDTHGTVKTLNTSVMLLKGFKATGEIIEAIEALEARIAALENPDG